MVPLCVIMERWGQSLHTVDWACFSANSQMPSICKIATIFDGVSTAKAKPQCTIKPRKLPPRLHLIGMTKMEINCPNSMTQTTCAAGLLKATIHQ